MKLNNNQSFSPEQKQYLEGFFAAVQQKGSLPFMGQDATGRFTEDPQLATKESVYGVEIDDLSKEERIKHAQNGLDVWDTMVRNATKDEFPQTDDTFRYKFYGLFHVTPAQDSFMLRGRVAGGHLPAFKFRGLADVAKRWGGGYLDLTTRGNYQIREIMPRDTIKVLMRLDELGLTAKGSGADNLRNITASPTSGFDPQEILDVMPYANAMHHYILNNRDLYGLPRKFNISFDNGGRISVAADTNDIGFYACRVENHPEVASGIYFRVQLSGITGHKQFASDSGILVPPQQAVALAAAMVRVFIENGDRTNRKKARLKYLIDDWGIEKFLHETEKKLTFSLIRFPLQKCNPRPPTHKSAHIGVHSQSDPDLYYIGVVIPVGRLLPEQVVGLADISETYGDGNLRLTIWQNLIIPHIHKSNVEKAEDAIRALKLEVQTSSLKTGLVACTGNAGCKFAASNTKKHAVELSDYLSDRFDLEDPINIHLTGCAHSCAQHYIGDIGLIGTKVKRDGHSVEGYNIVLGGGIDEHQAIAREVFQSIPFDEVKPLLALVLQHYLEHRSVNETFSQYSRRADLEALRSLAQNAA